MLRQTAKLLLLPRGALCHALSCQQQLLQPWGQQQSRSRSDATDMPGGDAVGFVHNPVDGTASELIGHADALVSASQAASDSVVLAAQAGSWWGTSRFIDLLMWTHEGLGLPWFEAIALSNLVIKACLMPLTVITQREAPKMTAMRAEAESISKLNLQMSKARSAAEYERLFVEYKERMADFRARNKGSFGKSLLLPAMSVAQAALFISQFSAVQMLAADKLPAMTHEGALWFTDLTLPDPYYGLPVICSLATLAMVRSASFGDAMGQMPSSSTDIMKKVVTGVALILIPMGGYASSAVALLWASNALISAGQNLLLGNAGVRRALGLPIKGVVEQPRGAAEGGSWLEQAVEQGRQMMGMQPQGRAAAAAPATPPPPGTRVAVNYVSNRPRRRGKSA